MLLVIGAMESELKEVIRKNELKKIEEFLYSGFIDGRKVLVAITGVGKVNASLYLTKILCEYRVDFVVNIGIAGATNDFDTNDLVLINETQYHDFDLTVFDYEKGEVPKVPFPLKIDDTVIKNLKNKFSNAKVARLHTGDSFVTSKHLANGLYDMEGCAFMQVCYKLGIKIAIIKIVSDIIGETKIADYERFEDGAAIRIAQIIKELI